MILLQKPVQKILLENVNSHGYQGFIGISGNGRGILRLLDKVSDKSVLVNLHAAESGGILPGNLDAGNGTGADAFDVVHQHDRIIHLVHMIPGKNQNVFVIIGTQNIQVLIHGVGSAQVPVHLVDSLLGRHYSYKLTQMIVVQKRPPVLNMSQQRIGFVLGHDAHFSDAGVEAVRQGEIDNPELASEMHGRLGPDIRKLLKPGTATSRKDQGRGFLSGK